MKHIETMGAEGTNQPEIKAKTATLQTVHQRMKRIGEEKTGKQLRPRGGVLS